MAHHPLYADLCGIVDSKYVSDSDFAVWACSRDASAYPARVPGIVVRPDRTEEIAEIVKLANRHKVAIVPRGGGTQYGGWPPGDPGKTVCIDMTRMRRILDINELNSTVTVEAGITGAELEERLRQRGLYAHTTFSPPDSVTIGGGLCGVFGGGGQKFASLAANWPTIVGVKAVLPNGDIVETGTRTNKHSKMFSRAAFGPDLTGLFIGSYGIFGIVTEVTQELFHRQPFTEEGAAVYRYERLDDAYRALVELGQHEPKLCSLGGLFGRGPFGKANRDWQLIYQVAGHTPEEVNRKVDTAAQVIKEAAPPDAWQPEPSVGFAKELFLFGHDSSSSTKALGMGTFTEFLAPRDSSLPIFRAVPEMILEETEGWKGRVSSYLCAMWLCGDQHYMSFVLYHKETDPEAREKALALAKKTNTLGLEMGAFKLVLNKDVGDVCAAMIPETYSNWLRTLKQALDPNNIMNPHMLVLP
jgi:FAD/FMN-containing dehydrogenase